MQVSQGLGVVKFRRVYDGRTKDVDPSVGIHHETGNDLLHGRSLLIGMRVAFLDKQVKKLSNNVLRRHVAKG